MIMDKWDERAMETARLWSTFSSCLRGQVGATLFQGKRMIASGYNGAPPGMLTCVETGSCYLVERDGNAGCERCLHAEENCILQCAIFGVSCAGATLYVTRAPCPKCTSLILGARIARVVFDAWRPSADKNWMLRDAVLSGLLSITVCDSETTPEWLKEYQH